MYKSYRIMDDKVLVWSENQQEVEIFDYDKDVVDILVNGNLLETVLNLLSENEEKLDDLFQEVSIIFLDMVKGICFLEILNVFSAFTEGRPRSLGDVIFLLGIEVSSVLGLCFLREIKYLIDKAKALKGIAFLEEERDLILEEIERIANQESSILTEGLPDSGKRKIYWEGKLKCLMDRYRENTKVEIKDVKRLVKERKRAKYLK